MKQISISSKLPLLFNAGLALLILVTLIFATPYTVSAIFLFQGSSALEGSLQLTDQNVRADNITLQQARLLASTSRGNPLLARAIRSLQQAIQWDRRNERAYRALVKAYYLNEDQPAAVEPLKELTQLYPEDLLLHMELGDALSAAGQVQEAAKEWKRAGVAVADPPAAPVSSSIRVRAEEFGGPPEWNGIVPRITTGGVLHAALFTNGCLNRGLYFAKVGLYDLRVRAYNTPPGPALLNVKLDGQVIGTFEYDSRTWLEVTALKGLVISEGVHRVELCFANDYQGALGDRNVYLEWFELEQAP